MINKARIQLVSTNPNNLAKVCDDIKRISEKTGTKIWGPIAFPTKRVVLPVRKSPCGNGTQTWNHLEMKIHKRLIDINVDEKVVEMLKRLNVPKDITIEISI